MKLTDVAPHPRALGVALLLLAGGILALEQPWKPGSSVPPAPPDLPKHLAAFPAAPDFGGATGWVQTDPLDLVALRGQVVLVDFWTYSCVNCIRTFPHVQGWYERYKDHGFVVVGVHTPEFRFERDSANVAAATQRYGLTYPVALDNDYAVWGAYHNRFWPAEYLIDAYGRIRHTHFGEGGYAETEQAIRALLAEAGRDPGPGLVEQEEGPQAGGGALTPELYAAAAQGPGRVAIGNPEGYRSGETVTYARPSEPAADRIFLAGTWHNAQEYVEAAGPDAAVLVRFRAAEANFVAAGAEGRCARLLLDGASVSRQLAGRDVREEANATCVPLDGARNYNFFGGPFAEHLVEVRVPEGFRLFTFTFSSTSMKGSLNP